MSSVYPVILERDEDSGGYVVTCPAFEGCYTQGETVEEALAYIREAIELCIEDIKESNGSLPRSNNVLVGSVTVAV